MILTGEEITALKGRHFVMDRYGESFNFIDFARDVESAVLEKLLQQEPVAWVVRNGVGDYQLFGSKPQADALCTEMQETA